MLNGIFPALPEASAHAAAVDHLFEAFAVLSALLVGPVFILIFVFAIRYRRGKDVNRDHAPDRKVWLEVSWSLVPTLLILGFFIVSAKLFYNLHNPPQDGMPITVIAKQWMWKFQHPQGQREINELHVPVGQPILLNMTSQDVIHSLYIPALRIKQDVLPGRYTSLWFTATRPGRYRLHCAEYCGLDHATMGGTFVAMTPGAYADWLDRQPEGNTPEQRGAALYRRLDCDSCHGAGSAARAPDLDGIAGRQVTLANGRSVTADDQYLHDAIMDPNLHVVTGYRAIMPTYTDQIDEAEVADLIAYLKTRKGGAE